MVININRSSVFHGKQMESGIDHSKQIMHFFDIIFIGSVSCKKYGQVQSNGTLMVLSK